MMHEASLKFTIFRITDVKIYQHCVWIFEFEFGFKFEF